MNKVMTYNFQKFTGSGSRFVVKISIARPGGLSMTSGFYSKFGISKYNSADLYYDKDASAVAIKFFTSPDDGSFKVKHRENAKGGYISAISFIKMYGLDKFFGNRFEPTIYDDEHAGQLFVLSMGQ